MTVLAGSTERELWKYDDDPPEEDWFDPEGYCDDGCVVNVLRLVKMDVGEVVAERERLWPLDTRQAE